MKENADASDRSGALRDGISVLSRGVFYGIDSLGDEATNEAKTHVHFTMLLRLACPSYDTLMNVKQSCWESEHLAGVFDGRYKCSRPSQQASNSGSGSANVTAVDAYYYNFLDHMGCITTQGTAPLPANATVLDIGCAPGGTTKFWIEECGATVLGLALSTAQRGFPMAYKHPKSHVHIRNILDGPLENLVEEIHKGYRRYIGQPSPEGFFDVIHCGAVIQSFMKDDMGSSPEEQYRHRQRLSKTMVSLALQLIKDKGSMIVIFRLGYNILIFLSYVLPLFGSFKIFRTNFRCKSQFQIYLRNFSAIPKRTRTATPKKEEDALVDAEGFTQVVCDFGFQPKSRRSVLDWIKSQSVELEDYENQFLGGDRHSFAVAEKVFRSLIPQLDPLFCDQIEFLEYIRQQAIAAGGDLERLAELSQMLLGGRARGLEVQGSFEGKP